MHKLEKRKLEDLTKYDRNPRNNALAIDRVLESLKLHGQIKPLVLSAKGHPFDQEVVCCGHTTLMALERFGAKEALVMVVPFRSESEFVDYNIRDNKTGEFAEWDEDALASLAADFDIDVVGMGFDFKDKSDDGEEDPEFKDVDENIETDHTCPKCGYAWSGGK